MAESANTGRCELCGERAAKPQMARHLDTCAPAYGAKGPAHVLLRLRFEGAGDPRYWIDVEAREDALGSKGFNYVLAPTKAKVPPSARVGAAAADAEVRQPQREARDRHP